MIPVIRFSFYFHKAAHSINIYFVPLMKNCWTSEIWKSKVFVLRPVLCMWKQEDVNKVSISCYFLDVFFFINICFVPLMKNWWTSEIWKRKMSVLCPILCMWKWEDVNKVWISCYFLDVFSSQPVNTVTAGFVMTYQISIMSGRKIT